MPTAFVYVEVDGIKTCVLVDPNIFDDPFLEAATRVIERNRNRVGFAVTPTMRCQCEKQVRNYNAYWVLVNAALYTDAERLRALVKRKTKCDLATQPWHGGDIKLDAYA